MSKPREHIVHRWAHNKNPKKTGTQGNMSFKGMKIYSYSTVIAVKYPNKKGDGGTCVFAGEGIYNSTSTMKHKSKASAALPPGWVRITADMPPRGYSYSVSDGTRLADKEGLKACHKHMVAELKAQAQEVKDAKSYSSRARKWKDFIWKRSTLEKLSTFLRLKIRTAETFGLNTTEEDLNLARWDAKCAERPGYNRPPYNYPVITPEQVERWRAHGTGSHMVYSNNPVYLRLSKTGEFVQTSANAHVPVRDAEMLFLLCKKCKMHKKNFSPDRPVTKVGTYQLLNITENGDAKVGCHILLYDEMERLYTQVKEGGRRMPIHTVKLSELFERIASGYYDGNVIEQATVGEDCGDTLATYVIRELRDVADKGKIVLESAAQAVESSISDLTDVQNVITDYIRELDER